MNDWSLKLPWVLSANSAGVVGKEKNKEIFGFIE